MSALDAFEAVHIISCHPEKEHAMLYSVRFRLKESLQPQEMAEVNKLIDTKIIPAVEKVDGVRSAQFYQSITGEITGFVDIENLAAVDRILADSGCRAVFGEMTAVTIRTGGEVFYDRPVWQNLYHN
jgi:hypothetical protein